MAVKRITILGSTGSVGTQTLDLIAENPEFYEVCALIGGRNAQLLAAQAKQFRPAITVISDETQLPALREALAGENLATAGGRDAVLEAAARPVDWTMSAITGVAGLEPTLGRHAAMAALSPLPARKRWFPRAMCFCGRSSRPGDVVAG